MKKWMLVTLPFLGAFVACDRTEKFDFLFTNRDTTSIVAQVNGNEYGVQIPPGNARSFTVELEILESSPTGPNTADVAQVTTAARSPRRGQVSRPRTMTVYSDRVNAVTIEPNDFR